MIGILQAFLGFFTWLGLAYMASSKKEKISWRLVAWGIGLQGLFVLLVLGWPRLNIAGPFRFIFQGANDLVGALLSASQAGAVFVFGPLANTDKMGFVFAIQVLPTIIFISSLMALLYHWGLMQKVVHGMASLMARTMRTGGAESLAVAANVFMGQTEAPLLIRPYLNKMTTAELFAVMVGGMATVSGSIMAAYVGLLQDRIPDVAGHLLTASVLSAPAALVMAKIIFPDQHAATGPVKLESAEAIQHKNWIDAIAHGAAEGLKLAVNVAAMLIAFIALLALLDMGLAAIGQLLHFDQWGQEIIPGWFKANEESRLSLAFILGWLLRPVAWLLGIPWQESAMAAALVGEKVVINEFVAYLHLSELKSTLSERTVIILSYALCGFANFSSIGIQIAGIGGLAPNRRQDLAALGLRAVFGGTLAAFMTASWAALVL